jgi:hypothetical protein
VLRVSRYRGQQPQRWHAEDAEQRRHPNLVRLARFAQTDSHFFGDGAIDGLFAERWQSPARASAVGDEISFSGGSRAAARALARLESVGVFLSNLADSLTSSHRTR